MNKEQAQDNPEKSSVVVKFLPEEVAIYNQKIADLGLDAQQVEPNPNARGGFLFYQVSGDRRLIQKIFEPQPQGNQQQELPPSSGK